MHIKRPDGYKKLAYTFIKNNINPEFDYILPLRTEHLDKYFKITGKKLSIYTLNSDDALKTYLSDEEIYGLKHDKSNSHKYYKTFLLTETVPPQLEKYIAKEFMTSENIVLVCDRSITMFSDKDIKTIASSENYEKYPLQFLRLSKLNNCVLSVLVKNLHPKKHFIVNEWEIFLFGI